jgi:hypothetical protein
MLLDEGEYYINICIIKAYPRIQEKKIGAKKSTK